MTNNNNLILARLKTLQLQKQTGKLWNITWTQGVFISNLISIIKPKKILEIGTSNGFSTLWIAKELDDDAIIDTIEVNEKRLELAKNNFKSCNLCNINCHLGDVFEVIPNMKKNRYEFIFLDAGQAKYLEIVKILEKNNLFADDFTLIADNVKSHDYMDVFVNYMKEHYFVELINIGGGFLFAKKKFR